MLIGVKKTMDLRTNACESAMNYQRDVEKVN